MASPFLFRFNWITSLARLSVGLLGAIGAASLMQAQAIVTWSGALNISGDADVVTEGSTIFTANLGPDGVSAVSLNGITFQPFAIPGESLTNSVTVGSAILEETAPGKVLYPREGLGSLESPFAELSVNYQLLLSTGAEPNNAPLTLTLTFSDLLVNHDYLFQWWTNDSSGGYSSTIASDGLENDLTLSGGLGPDGYTGKFGIGTFTATEVSQIFYFTGNDSSPLLNAFQLRDVTAIPEPSTYAGLAALVAFSFAVLRRRRARLLG